MAFDAVAVRVPRGYPVLERKLAARAAGDFMKVGGMVLGMLLVLVGVVWILQGINLLPGSFMTGQMQWAAFGAIAVVALSSTVSRWRG